MRTLILLTVTLLTNACPDNFVSIGSFCYHFSDVEDSWDVARGACRGIGSINKEYVIPAVLDLGSVEDNQLLLNEIQGTNNTYWLGGSIEMFKDNRWQWIYNNEKDIDLAANYWYGSVPVLSNSDERFENFTTFNATSNMTSCNTIGKYCTKTYSWTYRTYIAAASCDSKFKVICQLIPDYNDFRTVGNGKFYFSAEAVSGNISLEWEEARNVCRSMSPPNNFDYVDLVSSVDPDTDQQLLKVIAQYGYDAWLGGFSEKNESVEYYNYRWTDGESREYKWVDGSVLDKSSYLLDSDFHYNYPDLWKTMVTYANIDEETGKTRATIRATYSESWEQRKTYVCQAYKN